MNAPRTGSMRGQLAFFSMVWHKREYRAFILTMVFLSLAVSSTLPLITLYLVDHLHVSISLASLFFVFESLAGLVLGLAVGRWSDHWHSRLPVLRLASAWVAAGWLVFAISPYFWLSVVAGALFLSAGTITMGQAFAAVHDVMVRDDEGHPGFVNTTVRTAFSFGFVLGPLLGSQLAGLVSFRAAFVLAGGLSLLCLLPLWGLDIPVSGGLDGAQRKERQGQDNRRLYVFVVLCVLVLIGTGLRITYLPIDVTKHLGGSIEEFGTVMAVSPLAELLTLPAVGLLALRFSIGRLFTLGLAAAVIEYAILAFNTAVWQVYLTQAIDSLVVAVVFGLGLTYAQELSPGRAGLASSAFGAAFGLAILVGNLIGGIGVSLLGVPLVFLIGLVTSCVALMIFLGLDRAVRAAVRGRDPGTLTERISGRRSR